MTSSSFHSEHAVVSNVTTKFNSTFNFLTLSFEVERVKEAILFFDDILEHIRPYKSQTSKIGCGIRQVDSYLEPFYIEFRSELTGEFIALRLTQRLQSQSKILEQPFVITLTINRASDPVIGTA
jgi:hypothetical protein